MTGANSRSLYAVVEDQPLMAELVSEMLTSAGSEVEVEVFTLGQHLLKSKNLKNFKAVIMDLSLPDIDGFDLMEQLAVDNKGLPIVLMSGHQPVVVGAAALYADGVGLNVLAALNKPFTMEQLLGSLGLDAGVDHP